MSTKGDTTAEGHRLAEDSARRKNWKRWGPYLAERQWGTVREDYSANGTCWEYFPHDQARSRAYRWGEDGLLGICDRECRLCFALALWNGRDPILKERLFGVTGHEGNHGEDVKECYFYLDSTPTHSLMKALYKYPQAGFPYTQLIEENRRRGRNDPEFELEDTGVFDENRYFDVTAEYAKAAPDDILIRITIANQGPDAAAVVVLPTLWFRNTWSWGRSGEGYWPRPGISLSEDGTLVASHDTLGRFHLAAAESAERQTPEFLFTENETNTQRLFDTPNARPYVKDAFHEYVLRGRTDAINPARRGTKAACLYRLKIPSAQTATLCLRLYAAHEPPADNFGPGFDQTFAERIREAGQFYADRIPAAHVEWTYKPGAFTLGDLVRHLAVAERHIWAETVHHRPVAYITHGRELADGRDAVLAFLDRMHAESMALFRELTPEALSTRCPTPGGTQMTTWKWLRMMTEHEIHHRGQIYTLLGMLNVATPPLYGMTAVQVQATANHPA